VTRAVTAIALALVLPLLAAGRAQARVHEHWIAAEPVHWTIAPNGRDAIHDRVLDPLTLRADTVRYRAYTRDFGEPLRRDPDQGIVGPLLRGRVGDRFVVHFMNSDQETGRAHSMHFHGVHYRFGSDGSYIPGFSGKGANVKPGEEYTYHFTAGRDSVGVWPYHDHSPSMEASIAGGLYGALSIFGLRERRPDREFVSFLAQFGDYSSINGRAFVGNTPVQRAKVGDRVQWDVLTLGDDFHTFHVHGHRWRGPDGVPEDTRTLGPADSFRVRWREDRPGTWLYHCHVESHMMNGMIGIYRVTP
jgi:FtsP/CotA-like multicopper oxidase with cupredoxin domain